MTQLQQIERGKTLGTGQEKLVTAILIKATDLSENDKLVRLFTAEEGVVTAKMKGVKKPTAKLKFGCLPFAFCQYNIATKYGNTVTNCSMIENLFAITSDINNYYVGTMLLEISDVLVGNSPNSALFVELLRALKNIIYSGNDCSIVASKFVFNLLVSCGYAPNNNIFSSDELQVLSLKNMSENHGLTNYSLLKKLVKLLENNIEHQFVSAKFLIK